MCNIVKCFFMLKTFSPIDWLLWHCLCHCYSYSNATAAAKLTMCQMNEKFLSLFYFSSKLAGKRGKNILSDLPFGDILSFYTPNQKSFPVRYISSSLLVSYVFLHWENTDGCLPLLILIFYSHNLGNIQALDTTWWS